MSNAEELLDGAVIRLAKVKDTFPADSIKPLEIHFDPSSDEKSLAEATGKPLRISEWDHSRTSVSEAQAIVGLGVERIAFALRVAEVRSIRIPGTTNHLRIVRDPIDPPLAHMPGANGHCGLEGLGKELCPQKDAFRFLRSKLKDLASRITDESKHS
ncbi:MAG: hypothetical protein ACRD3V_21475 [Vicinamibacteria bacterium]